MNKLSLAAIMLSVCAISCLLATFATRIAIAGNDRESLSGGVRSQTATPAKEVEGGGYRHSNLLWLNPAKNGTADANESEQNPISVDAGEWLITISGENVNDVSWRETPDEIVITISGTLPDGDGTTASAPTY